MHGHVSVKCNFNIRELFIKARTGIIFRLLKQFCATEGQYVRQILSTSEGEIIWTLARCPPYTSGGN
jgi:hypothetical protein